MIRYVSLRWVFLVLMLCQSVLVAIILFLSMAYFPVKRVFLQSHDELCNMWFTFPTTIIHKKEFYRNYRLKKWLLLTVVINWCFQQRFLFTVKGMFLFWKFIIKQSLSILVFSFHFNMTATLKNVYANNVFVLEFPNGLCLWI